MSDDLPDTTVYRHPANGVGNIICDSINMVAQGPPLVDEPTFGDPHTYDMRSYRCELSSCSYTMLMRKRRH